jgi:hypothetical protein
MGNRTFAAGFVALVLAAWMFTPGEAVARGGFARAGAFAPGAFKAGAFKAGALRFHGAFRQQRYGLLRYGAFATVAGYGGYSGPDGTVIQINNQIPRDGFDRPVQRVCRAETFTVPSESGGTRDVTVTRCFKE